jgi:hypothetical protein
MRPKNARLVVLVAAVAVAAVAIGGVLAYRQGPQSEGAAAAPLSGPSTPAGTPTTTPASTPVTPSATPSTTPSGPAFTGPAKVTLKLSKLPKGRDPQVAYLIGREIRGGAGLPIKIPGSEYIQEIARLGDAVLAIVTKGNGTELLKVDSAGNAEHTADVTSVVTTADQTAAAYAATRTGSDGGAQRGGTIYAQNADSGEIQKLSLPKAWETRVLAYLNGKVYFRWGDSGGTTDTRLYTWTPGTAEATHIKTINSPTAVTRDGLVAASKNIQSDYGTCSTINVVDSGKRLWRTCENLVTDFTHDGAIAVGGPAYGDGYAPLQSAALDAKKGKLLREWSGASFIETVVEDDQHFLMIADDGPDTPRGVIRCSVTTGDCEIAIPLTTKAVKLAR